MSKPERIDAVKYVGHYLLAWAGGSEVTPPYPIDHKVTLVGWQCGFEPMFVAIKSPMEECSVLTESAVRKAKKYLLEIGWFSEDAVRDPDYAYEAEHYDTQEPILEGAWDDLDVQKISDLLNAKYLEACETSQPEVWGDAARLGRQLVLAMGKLDMIKDNYKQIRKDYHDAHTS